MILFKHQKIVDKCLEYLIGLGWNLSDKEFFNRRFFPDVTLEDDYERTLFAEIKPSDATTGELNKGIGQTLISFII